jgi:hypothetical protein
MSFFNAVIPDRHVEYTSFGANIDLPKNTVNIIINDVAGGTSITLEDMAGNSVTHDNLAARDEITGRWRRIMAAGTTLDSVIAQSII